jgi:hypothetical protein
MSVFNVARHARGHLALVSAPRLPAAVPEDFYKPPDPLSPGDPGSLVRFESMDAYLVPGVRLRVRAWRVLYRSTSALGEPTAVSGAVLLPQTRFRGPRPLIGYAVGTHGIGDSAAPSRLLCLGSEWEAGIIALVLARGWAVAITDYQGLGTPGDHTYMVGRALGRNVLDAMRAARLLAPSDLPAAGPAAVVGYSEGGAAAAWAAQLQPSYAPDVQLAGVAAGAAPATLETAGPSLEGSVFSVFIAFGVIGYAAAYPELDLESILTPTARPGVRQLRNSSLLQAIRSGPRFARASDMTRPSVFELPEWRTRLRENRLGTIAPAAPVLLHHARRDQIVSFAQSAKLRAGWTRLGADVRLHVTRGGIDHVSGAIAGTPVALAWIAHRIRGIGTQVGAVDRTPTDVVRPIRPLDRRPVSEAA